VAGGEQAQAFRLSRRQRGDSAEGYGANLNGESRDGKSGNDGESWPDRIVIKGAREHNLKNIDLEIPPIAWSSPGFGLGQVLARIRHHLRRR
jgi:hypothetical protein